MPRKGKTPPEASALPRVTYSGWTWQPGDVMPPSNRRAFFEPDPLVDRIVSAEMEDIDRIKRALDAAGTDPQKRDEILWMMIDQNSLHWMTFQSLLAFPEKIRAKLEDMPELMTVEQVAECLGITDRNAVYKWGLPEVPNVDGGKHWYSKRGILRLLEEWANGQTR